MATRCLMTVARGSHGAMKREEVLERSVKELGQWVSRLSAGGKCNPKIAAALQRGREALKMEKKSEN